MYKYPLTRNVQQYYHTQVNHQLGINRNARHQLERDLANKDQAISIGNAARMHVYCYPSAVSISFRILLRTDHTCHQLQNTSRSINVHGGIEKLDPNISIPDTWAENSNHNIQDSQSECPPKKGTTTVCVCVG